MIKKYILITISIVFILSIYSILEYKEYNNIKYLNEHVWYDGGNYFNRLIIYSTNKWDGNEISFVQLKRNKLYYSGVSGNYKEVINKKELYVNELINYPKRNDITKYGIYTDSNVRKIIINIEGREEPAYAEIYENTNGYFFIYTYRRL